MDLDAASTEVARNGLFGARLGGNNHKRSSHVELLGEDTNMKKALVSIAFGLTASLFATGASAQATLNSVKQKGFLTCGSNNGLAGSACPTRRAIGPASTSISAAPSRPPSSTTRPRFASFRSPPRTDSR